MSDKKSCGLQGIILECYDSCLDVAVKSEEYDFFQRAGTFYKTNFNNEKVMAYMHKSYYIKAFFKPANFCNLCERINFLNSVYFRKGDEIILVDKKSKKKLLLRHKKRSNNG